MRREDLNRDLTQKRSALFGIIRYLASSPSLLECHYWFGVCLYQYDRYRLSYGMAFGLVVIFISSLNAQKMTNAILEERFYDIGDSKKEDESYANANCTHRCMCDSNAAVVCLYFNEGR